MSFIKNAIFGLKLGSWFRNEILNTRTIEYIDFCPTWKCNSRCATCGSWKRDPKELQPYQYENLINDKAFKKVRKIVIEGGEPTLWNYLYDFLYRFMKLHPKCRTHVITNGFKPDTVDYIAGSFKREFSKQLSWSVSLNGIGEIHDKSRGVKGVFDKTVKTATILRDHGYTVAFSYVPFKENVKDYPNVVKLGKSLNIPVWVCTYTDIGKFNYQTWEHNKDEAFEVYYHALSEQRFYQKWAYEYFLWHLRNKKIMPCWGGRSVIHINPEGQVKTCPLEGFGVIGELREKGTYIYPDREETLKIVPTYQYIDGKVCYDCHLFYAIRNSMPRVLAWKLRHVK